MSLNLENYCKLTVLIASFLIITFIFVQPSLANDMLIQRVNNNESIRIGFANEVPWAYPGKDQKPLGFVNAITIDVLHHMGYTNIQPVVTDWAGLIPGLKAGRFDLITGGMYILSSRCQNVNFSEPIGRFGENFIVAKGNPKGIQSYKDIKEKGAVMVTGAGYSSIENGKKEGLKENQIMIVPGNSEILAAVRSGRADAGGGTYFSNAYLTEESDGTVEMTDPKNNPEWTYNWAGIGLRKSDTEFLAKFNKALKEYLGTEAMLETVKEYGYTKDNLPGEANTKDICASH